MGIRTFQQDDFEEIITLWGLCQLIQTDRDPEADIERKMLSGADLFLVAEMAGEVVGTIMGGYDGYQGSAYYLEAHPEYRGRGISNALISRLEKKLIAKGCPQIMFLVPEENDATICMCQKMAYEELQQENILYTKRLIDDQAFE